MNRKAELKAGKPGRTPAKLWPVEKRHVAQSLFGDFTPRRIEGYSNLRRVADFAWPTDSPRRDGDHLLPFDLELLIESVKRNCIGIREWGEFSFVHGAAGRIRLIKSNLLLQCVYQRRVGLSLCQGERLFCCQHRFRKPPLFRISRRQRA